MSRALALLVLVPLLAACTQAPAVDAASLQALSVMNAKIPAEGLVTAGQLTQTQAEVLEASGYRTFINLRPADEPGTGWEERWAEGRGIAFIRLPVAGGAGVTVENARRLGELMDAAEGPVVVYCGSGNRVGALLALEAHFVEGRSKEDALAYGLSAGLTRLEPRVRELLELPADG